MNNGLNVVEGSVTVMKRENIRSDNENKKVRAVIGIIGLGAAATKKQRLGRSKARKVKG